MLKLRKESIWWRRERLAFGCSQAEQISRRWRPMGSSLGGVEGVEAWLRERHRKETDSEKE